MDKVVNFVKQNKIKFIVISILLILVIVGLLFVDYKNKEYNLTEVSDYKYYMLNKDGKYGVIDTSGNILIEPIYDNIKIPNPEKAIFICKLEDKSSILNEKDEEIFTQYEEVEPIILNGVVSSVPYEKKVLTYKKDGKYGLINYNGKEITKPIYEEIKSLENKESELLVKKDGKYGVINSKGARLIKEEYDNIVGDGFYTSNEKYEFSGYIVSNKTNQGYRYGYIDYKHKKILEVEYNSIDRILENVDTNEIFLLASKNGQFGIVKNNKVLINYAYQGIEYDKDNKLFELQRSGKYGVADYNGKEIIPVEYIDIEIKGRYIKTLKSDDTEPIYYNVYGEKIENTKYTYMLDTENENYYITIDNDGFYGIINKDNNELIENKYNYLEYLYGDYFIAAKEDGYLGVINTTDEVLVEFKYEVLQKIEGTNVLEAKVLKENKSELYSKDLEKVYSSNNASIYKSDNYITAYHMLEPEYFDFNGKKLENKDIFINNQILSSKLDDKWGFIDRSGNVIIDYQYDAVTEFNDAGFAGICKDNKWGIIDTSGNILQEPIYKIEGNTAPEFLGKYYKVYFGYGECYYTNIIG